LRAKHILENCDERRLKFICHSVDNQNLLISSRSVPVLIGNTLCKKSACSVRSVSKQTSQTEISNKGKKQEYGAKVK
jgi:hypothetical protein